MSYLLTFTIFSLVQSQEVEQQKIINIIIKLWESLFIGFHLEHLEGRKKTINSPHDINLD